MLKSYRNLHGKYTMIDLTSIKCDLLRTVLRNYFVTTIMLPDSPNMIDSSKVLLLISR